jgi:hypothetical protein
MEIGIDSFASATIDPKINQVINLSEDINKWRCAG